MLLREKFVNCARGPGFRSVNWRSWWELPHRSSVGSKMPITKDTSLRCSIFLQPPSTDASRFASFRCGTQIRGLNQHGDTSETTPVIPPSFVPDFSNHADVLPAPYTAGHHGLLGTPRFGGSSCPKVRQPALARERQNGSRPRQSFPRRVAALPARRGAFAGQANLEFPP